MKIMWWGYEHCNGKLILKRWFGDHKDYTDDCIGNDFVIRVCSPFEADTEVEAWKTLQEKI